MNNSLKNKYKIYLLDSENLKEECKNWFDQIKEICEFDSIEGFWGYYQYLVRPQELNSKCEFLVFKNEIKPQWEAQENQEGGRFKVRVKKQYANRFWEELLLWLLSEEDEGVDSLVNGVIATIKDKEVLFSVWVRQHQEHHRNTLRNAIRQALTLNHRVEVDYRDHPKLHDILQPDQQKLQ